MLDHVQIIKEDDTPKYAVIQYEEYLYLKDLLSDEEKLEDHLDYLHIQNVKKKTKKNVYIE